MKRLFQRLFPCGVAFLLCLGLVCPALAAEVSLTPEEAGAILREQGIYQGDSSGDLMLDKGLTRAELAAILTRIHGEGMVDPNLYTWACYFTDVPEWAKPYVGYCTANLLVKGYGDQRYGAGDPVTPAAACTVALRLYGYADGEGSAWAYDTACSYAVGLGLIGEAAVQGAAINRGDMAVLICNAAVMESDKQYTGEAPANEITAQAQAPTATVQSYTITEGHWSREDFSQAANPDVFTGIYDRALYNAIRQTIVDGTSDNPAYTMVAKGDEYSAVKNLLGRLEGVTRYEHYVPENFTNYYEWLDYFAVSAEMPENYQAPLDFIQPVIQATAGLTGREKVEYLNDYLGTLLTYKKGETAGVTLTFSQHTGELEAACGSYAKAFKFLCGAAGIPCFTISTENHTWNMVYVDGQWLHVDAAANDLYRNHSVLLTETYPDHTDRAPEQTAFLKELLVPGSTK